MARSKTGKAVAISAGLLALAAAGASAEATAPQDRLSQARVKLDSARAALFPAGQSRRDIIARRLAARGDALAPAVPARLPMPAAPATPEPPRPTGGLAGLLDLIAIAEADARGYDTVHQRADRPPPAPPSRLTLGEVLDWVAATPGQPHAIGRYQFIPSTLADLMRREALGRETRFDAATQDRLALRLMRDAGLDEFLAGRLAPEAFMDELAYVWAGLPLASGLSAYHGYAGNRATISRAAYAAGFDAAFGLR